MSTKKVVMFISCIVLTAIVFLAISATHLWTSVFVIWGLRVSVWVGAVIIAAVLGLIAFLFNLKEGETPNWFVVALVIAVIACLVGGLVFTEPTKAGAVYNQENQEEQHFRSSVPYYYIFGNISSSGSSSGGSGISTSSGDSDNIGYIVLILVVLMIAVGSFIIPHFWVSAVIGILILLWFSTLKEMFVDDGW